MNLKHLKLGYYIITTLLLLTISSCNKDKLKADIPSYIQINNIQLKTDYTTEGSASANIKDAWVINVGVTFNILTARGFNKHEVVLNCIEKIKDL